MAVAEGHRKSWRTRAREAVHYWRMTRARARILARPVAAALDSGGPSLLILPADISDPTGSRGDEAMIQAVIDQVAIAAPGTRIGIATSGRGISNLLKSQGVVEAPLWTRPWSLEKVWAGASRYDRVVVIGADVMDGYYSSITSLRLWMLADLFARLKGKGHAAIGGSSFNASPSPLVRRFIADQLSPDLIVNVRDPVSHARFVGFGPQSARSVADLAFMLRPQTGPGIEHATAWLGERRTDGRIVCGLNIHPMLSPTRDPVMLDRLIDSFAQCARALIDDRQCSMLLIPHDFRGDVHGDVTMLNRLAVAIDRPGEVLVQNEPISAAEIKQLASGLDVVFTGRMHLAIAALGSGCPVVGITYQDKFDGLFLGHFALDPVLLIKAADAMEHQRVARALEYCVDNRDQIRKAIEDRLPAVRQLSVSNVGPLLETGIGAE